MQDMLRGAGRNVRNTQKSFSASPVVETIACSVPHACLEQHHFPPQLRSSLMVILDTPSNRIHLRARRSPGARPALPGFSVPRTGAKRAREQSGTHED